MLNKREEGRKSEDDRGEGEREQQRGEARGLDRAGIWPHVRQHRENG